MQRRIVSVLAAVTLLSGACSGKEAAPDSPPSAAPSQASCKLDALGGYRLTLTLDSAGAARKADLAALEQRARALNPDCPVVVTDGEQGLTVDIYDSAKVALTEVQGLAATGALWVAPSAGPAPEDGATMKRPADALVLDVARATVEKDAHSGLPHVLVTLSQASGKAFAEATEQAVGKILVLAVDDKVLMSPKVMEKIPGGKLQITLGAAPDSGSKARALAATLSSPTLQGAAAVEGIKQIGRATK